MLKVSVLLKKTLFLSHRVLCKPVSFLCGLLCEFKFWADIDDYFEGKRIRYKLYKILWKIYWKSIAVYLYLDNLITKMDNEELRPVVKD